MRRIEGKHKRPIVLWGMRRVGKTAVINQIELTCRERKYPVCKWLCTTQEPLSIILYNIIEKLQQNTAKLFPEVELSKLSSLSIFQKNAPTEFKNALIALYENVKKATQQNIPFVLLLDEMEVNGFLPGAASTDSDYQKFINFAQALKSILESVESSSILALVVASEYPWINQINTFPYNKGVQNPLFQRFIEQPLTFFDRSDCDEMIERLGGIAGLQYAPESLKHIYEETQGHPQVTRWLCSCILQICTERNLGRHVTSDLVTKSINFLLNEYDAEAYRSYFEQVFWRNPLSPDLDSDQHILMILAEQSLIPQGKFLSNLSLVFAGADFESKTLPALEESISRLAELSLIRQDRDKNLSISIPLYQKWIRVWQLGLSPEFEEKNGLSDSL